MELPESLKRMIEEKAQEYALKDLIAASEQLSARYLENHATGKRLARREVDIFAYSAARMPATFGAISSALGYALDLIPNHRGTIKTMTDFGAGTGAAAFAAHSLLHLQRIVCIEREAEMLRMGRAWMAADATLSQIAKWQQADLNALTAMANCDLSVMGYVLNELESQNISNVLKQVWEHTGTLLLIVEPGTPRGYRNLLVAQKIICALGGKVLAPCPSGVKCPLPDEDWCHFKCRVTRSKLQMRLKGGELAYEDEKYAYMAFVKEPFQNAEKRILRHPIKVKGCVELKLCTQHGVKTQKVRKQDAAYKLARKAKCGDAFEG